MGIRSNVGNIVTNANQVLAVGATTASRVFRDRADSSLNNLSKEERKKYTEMKTNQMRDEMYNYEHAKEIKEQKEKEEIARNPEKSIRYSEEEQKLVAEAGKHRKIRLAEKELGIEEEENSIDDLIKTAKSIIPETEEGQAVSTRMTKDPFWLEMWKQKPPSLEELSKNMATKKNTGGEE